MSDVYEIQGEWGRPWLEAEMPMVGGRDGHGRRVAEEKARGSGRSALIKQAFYVFSHALHVLPRRDGPTIGTPDIRCYPSILPHVRVPEGWEPLLKSLTQTAMAFTKKTARLPRRCLPSTSLSPSSAFEFIIKEPFPTIPHQATTVALRFSLSLSGLCSKFLMLPYLASSPSKRPWRERQTWLCGAGFFLHRFPSPLCSPPLRP